MNTDDLTAAVERLRDCADRDVCDAMPDDVRIVLSALESAQQDARRYRWLRGQMVHEHYGPLLGWTIGTLLPGDDPDAAIGAGRLLSPKQAEILDLIWNKATAKG